MPNSPPKPSNPTQPPSKTEDDTPATAPSTKAASPGDPGPAGAAQTVLARDGGSEVAGASSGSMVPRPTKTVECNMMSYTDGEGVVRQIYMPKGTMSLACALYAGKRFDDLARFPAWDNQTYDDWEADEEKYAYLRHELGEPTS